tara:strand:- start:701 stop:1678 length:978 start_codon:yes stop_codon:yes gene_type:complete
MNTGLSIRKISYHLPSKIETNQQLEEHNKGWDVDKVAKKTGILQRYIAAEDETSLDLGYQACNKLFQEFGISISEISGLLFVSQSPDYALPSSSCILQERLQLNQDIIALDINLGCSGFVNSLAVATSLINSNMAANCLIVCAETYSKFIDEEDRTNKLIFSDAASACLVERDYNLMSTIGKFSFGCDGRGANELIVKGSGCRDSLSPFDQRLFMNGPAILLFTLSQVPVLLSRTLKINNLSLNDVDLFVFHQASSLVLQLLAEKIGIEESKMYSNLSMIGNTVSSSIPIALKDAALNGKLKHNDLVLIIGFGVGYSLGSTIIKW